ncbi:dihydrolipoamide acetyltransferase family protein [Acidaminococcus sp. DS4831]|uniref:dihydrolipoamide acetyltransferase family protein n=1 Tax=Acidaminococcus sp. DS4831 TaxID=3141399 RepID=UPI0032E382D4
MAYEVRMPQLGLTMEEGTVTSWIKHEGEQVNVGDPLLEITTDKLTNEVTSEFSGTILKIVAQEGDEVPVKGVLAYIGNIGEKLEENSDDISYPSPSGKATISKEKCIHKNAGACSSRLFISPLAKKTADKMKIDYTTILGSGPHGRIIQKDILEMIKKQNIKRDELEKNTVHNSPDIVMAANKLMEGDVVNKLSSMRKVIAKRMQQSAMECPTVTNTIKVDVTELFSLRKNINEKIDVKYSVNDYIIKAVAKVLKNNRHMLVSIDGDYVIQRAHINLGMAVALDDGLITPVIKNADKMSLSEIHECAKNLALKARENKLEAEEYRESTITISNLGMYGVESFTPIINQPDSSILGICAALDELFMDSEGTITKHKVMRICHTYDHRLIDGSVAAQFECALKGLLERPIEILL